MRANKNLKKAKYVMPASFKLEDKAQNYCSETKYTHVYIEYIIFTLSSPCIFIYNK
jgi:hypothetical protein